MNFKFLESDKQYRLIGEWTKFLKHNSMHNDLVELGAFHSDGRLVLAVLHHAMEEQTSEETEAAEELGKSIEMTATSLGTAASGGGTLPSPFNKGETKTIKNRRLTGSCAAGAVDARNQEKAGNPELPAGSRQESEVVAVAALAPPPPPPRPLGVQEPVNRKRGHNFNGAAPESGNAIAEAATAATSSPIVQELVGNRDGGNPIGKKGHHFPWGSVGVPMDEKTEEKLRPCAFTAPVRGLDGGRQDWEVTVLDTALPSRRVQKPVERDHHHNGEEACCLIKRRCLATVCEGSNGAVDQNRAMPPAPSIGTQEPTRRSSPIQRAKGAGQRGRKNTDHSGRKTPMRPFMSLSSGLQFLGVTDVTPVLARTLTTTDSSLDQSRLQFSYREVIESPLMSILTPEEYTSVHKSNKDGGLVLEAIDRHGYSYSMRFKYITSARTYRLMQEWVPFLTQNSLGVGDMVEVGAFRVDGRPMLTLLNYARKGWIPEETEAADGLLMLSDINDGTRS
ncbi:hypothetical protein BAE44_0003080 [Dichanthelium oligosanthes]|uniref:TF-B3 domain-containing protein n=1 Tax=Dichanthelium oligosanthes TaxID=888268 RepID=A0A1E5WER9_9POAL|nr:hypothetical protein BAE44_0003080 [Dichanthelium oligosanthes]